MVGKTTIKPDDLVRTPDGRTAVCVDLNADGTRTLKDVITGHLFRMHRELLYLVRAATPRPWPKHVL